MPARLNENVARKILGRFDLKARNRVRSSSTLPRTFLLRQVTLSMMTGANFIGEMAGVMLESEVADALHSFKIGDSDDEGSATRTLADVSSDACPHVRALECEMAKGSPHASVLRGVSSEVGPAGSRCWKSPARKRRCAACGAPGLHQHRRSAVCASCAVRCVHATLSANFTTARSSSYGSSLRA